MYWYFSEIVVAERMRGLRRQGDQAQAWGLYHREEPPAWPRLRTGLGHWLIALGKYLQRGQENRRADLRSSSQCGLR
jgi:hypothetical protein